MAEAGSVDMAIAALGRLAERFGERRRALAAEGGLTERQWRVLEQIATEHFLPSLFARERACTPAAVSKTLRQLQEGGLVRAAAGPGDARTRVYALTARGRRRLERIRAARRRAIAAIWADLPPAELAAFARTATALAERLEAFEG